MSLPYLDTTLFHLAARKASDTILHDYISWTRYARHHVYASPAVHDSFLYRFLDVDLLSSMVIGVYANRSSSPFLLTTSSTPAARLTPHASIQSFKLQVQVLSSLLLISDGCRKYSIISDVVSTQASPLTSYHISLSISCQYVVFHSFSLEFLCTLILSVFLVSVYPSSLVYCFTFCGLPVLFFFCLVFLCYGSTYLCSMFFSLCRL